MVSEKFTYDKAKVIQALRYHFISRPEMRIMIILVNVFAVLAAVLYFMQKISPTAFFTSSIMWLILMIMIWFVMPNSTYRNAKTFKDSFKAHVNEEGFTIQNDQMERGWQWSEVSTFLETPHFFHIYFNPRSFFLIPKDSFAEEDEQEFRRILNRKFKK